MNIAKVQQELLATKKKLENYDRFLAATPSGYLHKVIKRGKPYYERREWIDEKRITDYIAVDDTETVLKYSKKAFAESLYPILRDNAKALEYFSKHYTPFPEQVALSKLPSWEAEIVSKNTLMTNEAAIKKWLAEPFRQNPYKAEQRCIPTLRGDCVRSKSEREIANELFRHKLAYKPDCEVVLADGSIYADFVIMHPKTLELYFWEHSGMLDSGNYVGSNFNRIARYASAGILIGERLIITGETKDHVLSSQTINRIIEAYFQ